MNHLIDTRQASDLKEREISRQIADQYPLNPPSIFISVASSSPDQGIELPIGEDERAQFCDELARRVKTFPLPLTSRVFAAALSELPSGASIALETCVRCWREGRLGADEVVSTARSFAGSSPTLSRALAAPSAARPRSAGGEVATPEQMDELSRLARSKRVRPATA